MNAFALQLVAFVCWSLLLWSLLQPVLRRWPAFSRWPALYWLLLCCCFLPFWPQLSWQQSGMIPPQLLLEVAESAALWVATPQHPSLLSSFSLADLVMPLLFVIWLLGACWRLGQLSLQWRRLRLLSAAATDLQSAEVLAELPPEAAMQLKGQLDALQLKQQSGLSSPFVFGFWRLHLVVPQNFASFPPTERLLLLQHELCHVRRCDPQQLLLWRVLALLFWFNPVLVKLEAAFSRAIEFTVDRQVLARQPDLALSYGKAMLSSLKYQQAADQLSAAFTQLRLDEQFYRQRLLLLFQPSSPGLYKQLSVLAVTIMFVTAFAYLISGLFISHNKAPERWQWPLAKVQINSGYGVKSAIRQYRPHLGLDLDGNTGDVISAAAGGRVLIADSSSLHANLGNVVLLDHGGGYQTLYAHLDQIQVHSGDFVLVGTQLGTVGSSGKVTGPHLHFEVLRFGQAQNPLELLPAR